jgi:hypothetical protein
MAPDGNAFWANIKGGRYCITDVPPERWDPALYYSTRPQRRRTRPTRRSAAGCVSSSGTRSAGAADPAEGGRADGRRPALGHRAARRALLDAGWPNWSTDSERVAVILGNAIGGEKHYRPSDAHPELPEALRGWRGGPHARGSPPTARAIVEETRAATWQHVPRDHRRHHAR